MQGEGLLTSHSYGRLSLSCIARQSRARKEDWSTELTSELVSLEMRLPREFCSTDVAFLGLGDSGNVSWMRLSSAVGLFGLRGATDYVFW